MIANNFLASDMFFSGLKNFKFFTRISHKQQNKHDQKKVT